MKFVIYGFLFFFLILPIFTSEIIFEKHGKKCQQGLDKKCGFNCKCNKSNLCECVKPQNFGALQYCYDNIPKAPHAVAKCKYWSGYESLFCHFHCLEGPVEEPWNYNISGKQCINRTTSWKGYIPECYHNDCNDDIIINKGLVKCVNSTKNEKICNISCRKGLTLIGNDKLTCHKPVGNESGWTGKKPMCLNSRCVELMVNKTIIVNAESQNCTVRARDNYAFCNITCIKGYWVEGKGEIPCNRTRGKKLPICTNVRKRCKHLRDGEVTNNLTITNCSTAKDGYQDYCGFKCNELFTFPGHIRQRVHCKFSKGEWIFPKCIYQPYRCKSLNAGGVNATCTLGARSIKNKPWSCDLECSEGFREDEYYRFALPGNLTKKALFNYLECGILKLKREKHLTCNYGNKWSGVPLKCLRNFDCKLPSYTHTTYNCTQKRKGQPFYCTVSCDEGYHLSGISTIMCMKNSHWDDFTLCRKDYDCKINHHHTLVECDPNQDFNSEWECYFECAHNKEVDAGEEGPNHCQKNGNWKKPPLQCR